MRAPVKNDARYRLPGGADGKPGRNSLIHANGSVEEPPGKATLSLGPGEIVVVETPGRRVGPRITLATGQNRL
jgi:N-methylhydantoinase B/oxoprolinase/acetone carboxylase alpha subunit